jgi:hypothetical protein
MGDEINQVAKGDGATVCCGRWRCKEYLAVVLVLIVLRAEVLNIRSAGLSTADRRTHFVRTHVGSFLILCCRLGLRRWSENCSSSHIRKPYRSASIFSRAPSLRLTIVNFECYNIGCERTRASGLCLGFLKCPRNFFGSL